MPKILIVDDNANNRMLMEAMFDGASYETVFASNGREALEKLAEDIDLVFSDVMMPDINGFELCQKIKENPQTRHVPVILVTAVKRKREDMIRGLETGADDYIIRPFEFEELDAKLRAQLRVKALYDQLAATNQELVRSQKMKEELTHMVVHDLRNPVSSLSSIFEMLAQMADSLNQETALRLINDGQHCANLLLMMISNILDIHKMEEGAMELSCRPHRIYDLVSDAAMQVRILINQKEISFQTDIPYDAPFVQVDGDKLVRVFANLIGNAVKFTPRRGMIHISTHPHTEGWLRISVSDSGAGIPKEDQARIFDKFEQVRKHQENQFVSSGLGLTFCKLAVEAHGGRIWVESQEGQGSTFHFTLPTIQIDTAP